jgi:hypothetical protein
MFLMVFSSNFLWIVLILTFLLLILIRFSLIFFLIDPQNYVMKVERNHQDSLLNYWFSDKYNPKETYIEIVQECD